MMAAASVVVVYSLHLLLLRRDDDGRLMDCISPLNQTLQHSRPRIVSGSINNRNYDSNNPTSMTISARKAHLPIYNSPAVLQFRHDFRQLHNSSNDKQPVLLRSHYNR